MNEDVKQSAIISALTTEHFVLQTAASATVTEAAARSSLYVFALSSSLVAIGFTSQVEGVFFIFTVSVLTAVFLIGLVTIVRLVDTAVENLGYLTGIARIRRYYRTLTPDASVHFAEGTGRWPEEKNPPSQIHGRIGSLLGTTAAMIALVNSFVAGALVTLGVGEMLGREHSAAALSCGVGAAVSLIVGFLLYQRWRFK